METSLEGLLKATPGRLLPLNAVRGRLTGGWWPADAWPAPLRCVWE